MKNLINEQSDIVNDFVEGLLYSNQNLVRLQNLNVVVRKDIHEYKKSFVTLISGGGSGHEPAHAGYIGDGMLSCAVLGNVFASPSISSILAAIRTCSGPSGTLLIVKNYTGDRLNFGMAMEIARQEGFKCSMVIVEDDCALPEGKGITGGRGVAGTVFFHKLAGSLSSQGVSLEVIQERLFQLVSSRTVGSIGVALSPCTIPGTPSSLRLEGNIMEVGMGIHGEPGREQREFPSVRPADSISEILLDALLLPSPSGNPRLRGEGDRVVVMVNNLGSLPPIELSIVTRGLMRSLVRRGLKPVRLYSGYMMTALDMRGLSLSLLRLGPDNQDLLPLLDSPSSAPSWVAFNPISPISPDSEIDIEHSVIPTTTTTTSIIESITQPQSSLTPLDMSSPSVSSVLSLTLAICDSMIALEPRLTELDSICGDGDCGIVMKEGASRVKRDILSGTISLPAQPSPSHLCSFCRGIADSIGASMGGTSGALLELFFRSAASTFSAATDSNSPDLMGLWAQALSAGCTAIQFYGGAHTGMRTMLDALYPATQTLSQAITNSESFLDSLTAASEAASQGSLSTAQMEGLAGRSNYVDRERMRGHPDPGAEAVSHAFLTAKQFWTEKD